MKTPKFNLVRYDLVSDALGYADSGAMDATALVAALADLCRDWKRDRHFTTEVMLSVGAVIATATNALEVE